MTALHFHQLSLHLKNFSDSSRASLQIKSAAPGALGTHCQEAGGHAHLCLKLSATFDLSVQNCWLDVQVIGQFCRDASIEYQDGLLVCARMHGKFLPASRHGYSYMACIITRL